MLYQLLSIDHISDVMASILASSAVDHGFKLWSGKTKSYKIGDSKGLSEATCPHVDYCFSQLAL
jgi:hypothetical protein